VGDSMAPGYVCQQKQNICTEQNIIEKNKMTNWASECKLGQLNNFINNQEYKTRGKFEMARK